MRSSYDEKDVVILLKDITGMVKPQSTDERERLIQSGKHYCEMLPIEYSPTQNYMEAYQDAVKNYALPTALAVARLADKIIQTRGKEVVLVSLARAGIPAGILLKRYMKWKYDLETAHYSISIIRGKGIDHQAMKYILERYDGKRLVFVDGWIGKGAIAKELAGETARYRNISSELAVLADPAKITELCGTHGDILIPSSCLNSTVSGLVSRTFLRDDIIGADDFHGAVYYEELKEQDLSYEFIDSIQREFVLHPDMDDSVLQGTGIEEVQAIAEFYSVQNIHLIKPGIGETTRVLLRRVPWKVLISESCKEDASLEHILRLAKEKRVPVEYYPLRNYKTCGIIKQLSDV